MTAFRGRFAPTQDIAYVFAACVFPIHVWAIINVLRAIEVLLLHLSVWELVGVLAYTQTFALLESVALLIALVCLGAVLPVWLLRDRFVVQGSLIVFLTSGWAIAIQYNREMVLAWNLKEFLPWVVLYLVSIVISSLLVHRYKRLEQSIQAFMARLAVLSFLYVLVDLLGVIIVVLRNL